MLGSDAGPPTRAVRPSWSVSVQVRGGMPGGRIAPAKPRVSAALPFGCANSTIASAPRSTRLATARTARRRRGATATSFQAPFRFGGEDGAVKVLVVDDEPAVRDA